MRSSPVLVARTGYTGEDGFEIFTRSDGTRLLWDRILDAGKSFEIMPCGLACRDTLRLEAGMCLYGNDIDETTTPLEAGLSFVVKFDKKTPFIGRDSLIAQKEKGISRKLVGLQMEGKNIARKGYQVARDGHRIGQVTSGTFAPFLARPIAMAYLDKPYFEIGTQVDVLIRERSATAQVVKLPFYKPAAKGTPSGLNNS